LIVKAFFRPEKNQQVDLPGLPVMMRCRAGIFSDFYRAVMQNLLIFKQMGHSARRRGCKQ